MSFDRCAELVSTADPDRFATAMCAPMPGRGRLMALYAFNVEVTRAAWVTEEPMIAEMRLQWWKDAIAEIYETRTPRAHDVVGPIATVIAEADLPRGLFDALIEARRFDIYPEGHENRSDFDRYIAHTSGNLMELAGRALGATSPEPYQSIGWAAGVAGLLGASGELYRRGRHPLPFGQIDRNALAEGVLTDQETGIVRGLIADAREKLTASGDVKPKAGTKAAVLTSWDTKRVLAKAGRDAGSVLRLDLAPSQLRRSVMLLLRSTVG